jgi:hypothetical protein
MLGYDQPFDCALSKIFDNRTDFHLIKTQGGLFGLCISYGEDPALLCWAPAIPSLRDWLWFYRRMV